MLLLEVDVNKMKRNETHRRLLVRQSPPAQQFRQRDQPSHRRLRQLVPPSDRTGQSHPGINGK